MQHNTNGTITSEGLAKETIKSRRYVKAEITVARFIYDVTQQAKDDSHGVEIRTLLEE